jgi:hypothetical protein
MTASCARMIICGKCLQRSEAGKLKSLALDCYLHRCDQVHADSRDKDDNR